MKLKLQKSKQTPIAAAFTLLELTVVLVVGILIASMSLTLFNFQLTNYRIIQAQNFLIHEAPQVNNTLNRIVARANFFRLYADLDDAETSTNGTITNAKVMVLQFNGTGRIQEGVEFVRSPDTFGVIHYDNTTNSLNYYHLDNISDLTSTSPSWIISDQIADTVFFVQNGVLRTRLTGPNGGEIIHSTTTQR